MFQTIVAEMTTKDKSYGDVFSEVTDSKALRIAAPPLLRIALRSSSDNPPHTPYSVFSGFFRAYSRHSRITGHFSHICLAASTAAALELRFNPS